MLLSLDTSTKDNLDDSTEDDDADADHGGDREPREGHREHDADHRERDRAHDEQRVVEALEGAGHDHIDQEDREERREHHALQRVIKTLRLSGDLKGDAVIFHGLPQHPRDLVARPGEVNRGEARVDSNAALALDAADLCGPCASLDLRDRGQAHRDPIDSADLDRADVFFVRAIDLRELDPDVELLFVGAFISKGERKERRKKSRVFLRATERTWHRSGLEYFEAPMVITGP